MQEVENLYQQIEDAMRIAEFYLPVSFLQLLLQVHPNQPYRVIQMEKNDLRDFMNSSKMLHFNRVP